jgi:membrane associated rhomboid family serine protease
MVQLPRLFEEIDRRPWATYGIALLLILLFLGTQIAAGRRLHYGLTQLGRAIAYQGERSGLRLDPRLVPFQESSTQSGSTPPGAGRTPRPRFKALEQVELDGITRGGFDALASTPLWRWGVVPDRFSPLRLFTYPFLHSGFVPLLLNLAFLLLCGPTLESDWGHRVQLGFWWVSGALGGAVFAVANLSLHAALVGSSGVVAALVTAFLCRHWGKRLRPFAVIHSARWSELSISAPGLAALWLLREAATPLVPDLVALPGMGSAVLWADAGGVLFAVCLLAAMRWGGLEERYLRRFSPRVTAVADSRAAAASLRSSQQPSPAERRWEQLLRQARGEENPADAWERLWETAVETGRTEEVALLLRARIRDAIHGADPLEAFEHWGRLHQHASHTALPLSLETRLAEALETAEHREQAREVLRSAVSRARPSTAPTTLARLLRLASGPERARVATLARAATTRSPELRAELALPSHGSPTLGDEPGQVFAVAPEPPCPSLPEPNGSFQPVPARPLTLGDNVITLELGTGVERSLHLSRVRALGAAAVEGDGTEPNLVLDLFLRMPKGDASEAKVVRLETHRFDPRILIPTETDFENAFHSIAGAVLTASGASWLLGENAHALRRYPSLEAYERDLVRVLRLGAP